ncbi:hypothetical protein GZH53_11595 [Flavihumibacter sp. R14]|nr:hypothetical protein [Flavihumibacter soli]
MDNLADLKAIWHTAKTESLPSPDEMLGMIKKFRRQKLRSKWLVILTSCMLTCLIIAVLLIVPFKFWTTYMGGGLMAASGVLLAVTNIRSLKRFYQLNDSNNLEFLAFIEQTRQNQIAYYKKMQVLIMSLTSIGLLFYLYEPSVEKPLWFIGIYTLAIAYLLIMWFWARPRYFKKHSAKLNATIQRLENLSNQLK